VRERPAVSFTTTTSSCTTSAPAGGVWIWNWSWSPRRCPPEFRLATMNQDSAGHRPLCQGRSRSDCDVLTLCHRSWTARLLACAGGVVAGRGAGLGFHGGRQQLVIEVTPGPGFSGLDRPDDSVTGLLMMGSRVPIP
jgi:hypothetical protein